MKKQYYQSPLSIINKYLSLIAFFLILGGIFFTGCKNEKKQTNAEPGSIAEMPDDFEKFFEKFHTDSVYQMNHITFPLEGMVKDPNSDKDTIIEYRWQKETWQLHHPFNNYDSLFTRKFYMFGDNIIIEKITGVNGMFEMERRFAKLNDGWNLIYYSVK